MIIERHLVTAVVRRSPDVVEPGENRSVHLWVIDYRDVEGLRLDKGDWIGDPIPPRLTVAVEVHVHLRREVGVEPDV